MITRKIIAKQVGKGLKSITRKVHSNQLENDWTHSEQMSQDMMSIQNK